LDTGRDVSIGLSIEDAALYASVDPDNFLTTSVCFCDFDYLDLNVSLLDEPSKPSKSAFYYPDQNTAKLTLSLNKYRYFSLI